MPIATLRHKLVAQTLTYVVAAGCLFWVFHRTNFSDLKRNLSDVRWPVFVLAAIFNISTYLTNAWRWRVLLLPLARIRYRKLLQAIYVGLFLNDVLPLRPGEIVRCGLISRWVRRVPLSAALSSITIERLVEAAFLQLGFIAVVAFTPVPKSLVYACIGVSSAVVAFSLFLVCQVRHARRHPEKPDSDRLAQYWRKFVNGLHLMSEPETMSMVFVLSAISLVLNVLATWAVMESCRISLSLPAAAAVLIIIRVGTAVPATPGSVGAYQFISVLALGLFGVKKTAAATFIVVAFAAFTVPLLIGGAIALSGTDYSTLTSLGEAAERNRSAGIER